MKSYKSISEFIIRFVRHAVPLTTREEQVNGLPINYQVTGHSYFLKINGGPEEQVAAIIFDKTGRKVVQVIDLQRKVFRVNYTRDGKPKQIVEAVNKVVTK